MKNSKELKTILTAIHSINLTSRRDNDIHNIVSYAFDRMLGENTNFLTLACVGRTKDEVPPEIMKVLKDTQYHNYIEKRNQKELKPRNMYAVITEWIKDNESNLQSFLYTTREQAREHFRRECIAHTGTLRGEKIFCQEYCTDNFDEDMFNEFDDDFIHVKSKKEADILIEMSNINYSCYNPGLYRFNVMLVEQPVDKENK